MRRRRPAADTPGSDQRLDAAQAGFEGTGLGLALSRHLVESMGGTLDVSSLPGKGSTFWLDLPTVNPAAIDHVVAEAAAEDAQLLALRGYPCPKRVRYVEDMVENVRLVEGILARRPAITLIPVMLAGVALDLAREHRPDLILLDLHLPDMPGEQLLTLLRAEPGTRDIPVVVLSADATRHHIDQLQSRRRIGLPHQTHRGARPAEHPRRAARPARSVQIKPVDVTKLRGPARLFPATPRPRR